MKFLVTSRPFFDIERGFAELTSYFPTVRLAGEEETKLIEREIGIVIKARVQKIGTKLMLNDSERLSLEKDLLNITHRTYLWLKLIFEVIEQRLTVTKKRLQVIVGTIPDTLDKAYEAILERSTDEKQARRLLHIIVSAIRPLTLREMNIALAIYEDSRSKEDLDLEPEDRFRTTVRNLCGLFVSVIDSRIYLIHQTAKEFLIKDDSTQPPSLRIWKHSLEPRESNLVLAEICIWYLLFTVFESDPLVINGVLSHRYINEHDFLDYSAKYWTAHFRSADVMEGAIVALALKVCNSRSKRFVTWFQAYWINVGSYSQCPQNFTDLMIGSYFGLEVVVRLLLEKGADIEAKDRDGRTALDWAAHNRHEEVIRLLSDKAMDIGGKGDHGWTALHWAAWKGYSAVAGLLLEKRANVEAKDRDGLTPLHLAAEKGHKAVVTLLLGKGANTKANGLNGLTALHLAAQEGHFGMVLLLLEGGVDVEAKDYDGTSALHLAAEKGHDAVVRLLLGKEANIEAKDRNGWTALHLAVQRGRYATVWLLLEEGADVEAKDNDGRTPLLLAAEKRHESVVRLLEAKVLSRFNIV